MCRCGDAGHRKPTGKKPLSGPVKIRYPSEWKRPEQKPSGKVCDKCNGFKKPPRGKKLALRRAFGSWMTVPLSAPEEDPPDDELDDEETLDNDTLLNQYRTRTQLPLHAVLSGMATSRSERSEPTTAFRLTRDFDLAPLPVTEVKPTFLWPGASNGPLRFEEETEARRSTSETTAPAEDVAPHFGPRRFQSPFSYILETLVLCIRHRCGGSRLYT